MLGVSCTFKTLLRVIFSLASLTMNPSKTIMDGDKHGKTFSILGLCMSERWCNWTVRLISTCLMAAAFYGIIYSGPMAMMCTVLLIQVRCFYEIINVGYLENEIDKSLPWFRSLSWYFLIATNYLVFGELLADYFIVISTRTELIHSLAGHHRLISFMLYLIGLVWFVLSLDKPNYKKQFAIFAWTHIALLVVVVQSYLVIDNMFQGIIWFLVPISMVIFNDIMAYVFGFFCGKTPLIQLSPKKTWEGFIGGGLSTVVFGLALSYYLCQFNYFICPIELDDEIGKVAFTCEPSPLYLPRQYSLPALIGPLWKMCTGRDTVAVIPFLLHSLVISVFVSVIGPFGGFFASGFKRAFNKKDFADVIPGHGGIMDRFDCQYIVATFVYVYLTTFIGSGSLPRILARICLMTPEQQLQVYLALKTSLTSQGVLQ